MVVSDGVGRVEGQRSGVGGGSLLLVANRLKNLLVEFVSCDMTGLERPYAEGDETLHTGILGLSDNLAEELGKVRKIVTEEVRLDDKGLTSMVRGQLAAEKFGLADDAKGGALLRVLHWATSGVVPQSDM